jgi:hypothetical protein
MNRNTSLFKIYWDEHDLEKVAQAITAGMNWATGPNIQEFERMLTRYAFDTFKLGLPDIQGYHSGSLLHQGGCDIEAYVSGTSGN